MAIDLLGGTYGNARMMGRQRGLSSEDINNQYINHFAMNPRLEIYREALGIQTNKFPSAVKNVRFFSPGQFNLRHMEEHPMGIIRGETSTGVDVQNMYLYIRGRVILFDRNGSAEILESREAIERFGHSRLMVEGRVKRRNE